MQERLNSLPHESNVNALVYEHGTHFVFPESMIHLMLPVGSELFISIMFRDGRRFRKECRSTRKDIDTKLIKIIREW